MLIYIFLVVEILLLNIIRLRGTITNKQFCGIIGISMILVTGLRSVDVGSDTTGYYLSFISMENISFSDLIVQNKRDAGFYVIAWAVSKYTGNFSVLTLIVAVVFYCPLSKLIAEYSDDCGLSYLTLMAFNFFQFSMTGMRQTMALGFAILFVLEILREHTRLPLTILWVVLGTLMHRSCLLVLFYYLIKNVRNNRDVMWGTVLGIPVLFLIRVQVTTALITLVDTIGFEMSEYEVTSGGGTTYLVYILIFVWGLFFTYKDDQEDSMPIIYVIIMGIATALQSFVLVNSVFFRVVWYYSLFMVIYIPKLLSASRFTQESRRIVRLVVYLGVLYMYLGMTIGSANVVPYAFYG